MTLYRTGKEIRRYVERIVDEEQQMILHSDSKLFNTKAYLLDKLECIDDYKTYEISYIDYCPFCGEKLNKLTEFCTDGE